MLRGARVLPDHGAGGRRRRRPRRPSASPRAAGWLLASGFVGLALGDNAYFQAIVTIGVRRSLLLLSTAPVFAAIGGALWLGEQLGAREWAAILAVMIGVGLVVEERDAGSADRPSQRLSAAGVLFGVAAGLGQATGSLMSRAAMAEGVTALDAAVVRLAAGVVGILIVSALSRRLVGYARALRRPRVMSAVAGSAAVGTYSGHLAEPVRHRPCQLDSHRLHPPGDEPYLRASIGQMAECGPHHPRALGAPWWPVPVSCS